MASSASSPKPDNSVEDQFRERDSPRGFRHHRNFVAQLLTTVDLILGLISLLLAAWLRRFLPLAHGNLTSSTVYVCGIILVSSILIIAAARHTAGGPIKPTAIAFVVLVTTGAIIIFLFFDRYTGNSISRPVVLAFAGLTAISLACKDIIANRVLLYESTHTVKNIVCIGQSSNIAHLLQHLPGSTPWRIAGCFEDSVNSLGSTAEKLGDFLRRRPIDEILLAPSFFHHDPATNRLYREVIRLCQQTGTKLYVYADWILNYRLIQMDHLGPYPLLTFSFAPDAPWALLAKRWIDLAVSLILLLLLSPVMLLAATAIKLSSPGPILFKQTRCGLRGRPFTIYKFRSMVPDAEQKRQELQQLNELSGPVFKIANDPRITRVGRWLRKTSIDELPQLINVIRGEMSLVGPRPPIPNEVEQYEIKSLRRLAMKPGITGLWQVSGRHQIKNFEEWVELDYQYIRDWSLSLDFRLMLRTLLAVAKMTGR